MAATANDLIRAKWMLRGWLGLGLILIGFCAYWVWSSWPRREDLGRGLLYHRVGAVDAKRYWILAYQKGKNQRGDTTYFLLTEDGGHTWRRRAEPKGAWEAKAGWDPAHPERAFCFSDAITYGYQDLFHDEAPDTSMHSSLKGYQMEDFIIADSGRVWFSLIKSPAPAADPHPYNIEVSTDSGRTFQDLASGGWAWGNLSDKLALVPRPASEAPTAYYLGVITCVVTAEGIVDTINTPQFEGIGPPVIIGTRVVGHELLVFTYDYRPTPPLYQVFCLREDRSARTKAGPRFRLADSGTFSLPKETQFTISRLAFIPGTADSVLLVGNNDQKNRLWLRKGWLPLSAGLLARIRERDRVDSLALLPSKAILSGPPKKPLKSPTAKGRIDSMQPTISRLLASIPTSTLSELHKEEKSIMNLEQKVNHARDTAEQRRISEALSAAKRRYRSIKQKALKQARL